eukprot:jgi/Psemu1/23533/gm1.23533_g
MCYGAWCVRCLGQYPGDWFLVLAPHNLENFLADNKKMLDNDTQRYKNPRHGNHLMTPKKLLILLPQGPQEDSGAASNRWELSHYYDFQAQLGMEVSCLPARGPTLQKDTWGMKKCMQLETVRRCRLAFTNYLYMCPDGIVTLVISDAALDYMEQEWEEKKAWPPTKDFKFTSLLAHYCEPATNKEDNIQHHVPSMTLANTFKNQMAQLFFTQPLAPTTRKGRNILEWFDRMLNADEELFIRHGLLFMDEERTHRASITRAIGGVVIRDSFSTFRSPRRGATSAVQNADLDLASINANNNWRVFANTWRMVDHFILHKASLGACQTLTEAYSGGRFLYSNPHQRDLILLPLIENANRQQVLLSGWI